MRVEFDCQKCGACCATFDVWLDEADLDRIARKPHIRALTVLHKSPSGWSGTFMQRDAATGQCRALAGRLGDCTCTVYEDRPELCRAFEAGSEDCLEARRRHGIE